MFRHLTLFLLIVATGLAIVGHPATGFVVKDGAGYDFQQALWQNTL